MHITYEVIPKYHGKIEKIYILNPDSSVKALKNRSIINRLNFDYLWAIYAKLDYLRHYPSLCNSIKFPMLK